MYVPRTHRWRSRMCMPLWLWYHKALNFLHPKKIPLDVSMVHNGDRSVPYSVNITCTYFHTVSHLLTPWAKRTDSGGVHGRTLSYSSGAGSIWSCCVHAATSCGRGWGWSR